MSIVKLADWHDLENAGMSRRNPSWLAAELPQAKVASLVSVGKLVSEGKIPQDILGFVKKVPIESLADIYPSDGIGYVAPSIVRKYFINDLNKEFEGNGLFHQVTIGFEAEWTDGRVGNYLYWRPIESIVLSHRDDAISVPDGIKPGEYKNLGAYEILRGPVLVDDSPPLEFIIEDLAGKFIPISQKWIEDLVLSGRSNAERYGGMWNPDLLIWPDYKKARKLAVAIKRGDLVELVDVAMEHAESLIAVGGVKAKEARRQHSFFTGTPRYKVELQSPELQLSWQSGMEEYESLVYHVNEQNDKINTAVFPFSLESLSTQAVVELMRHFAMKGYNLDYIQKSMKVTRLDDLSQDKK